MENFIKRLVSVVITTHNRCELVIRAIESVLNQTYKDTEIIVVDDCSNDDTEVSVRGFSNRLLYLRHNTNKGGVAARMTGTRAAKGEYIAFLDDDDQWEAEKIEKQVHLAKRSEQNCAVITCGTKIFLDGDKVPLISMSKLNGNIRDGILNVGLSTVPSCHLFRRSCFEEMGGYDLDLPAHNEHDIWMKMADMNYSTRTLKEACVIIYEDDRPRMMTDVSKRIEAFMSFNKKWEKKVYEWYGEKAGRVFWKRYLSDKMVGNAMLLAQYGNAKGAWLMFRVSIPYLSWRDVGKVTSFVVYLVLPDFMVKWLRWLKRNLRF